MLLIGLFGFVLVVSPSMSDALPIKHIVAAASASASGSTLGVRLPLQLIPAQGHSL